MKTPIAFYALFEWTEVYFQLARKLASDIEAFYITPAAQTRDRLLSWGVEPSRILDISATHNEVRRLGPAPRELLRQAEVFEGHGPTLPSLLMMSRFYPPALYPELTHYLCLTARRMEDFLRRNSIAWAVGEPTNAPDILLYSVARSLGIAAGNIAVARHPTGRIILLSDIQDVGIHKLAPGAEAIMADDTARWLAQFRSGADSKPAYFATQAKRRSIASLAASLLGRAGYGLKELTGAGQVNYSPTWHSAQMYGRRFYSGLRRYDGSFDGARFRDGRAYAVYFLHVQPERSIDVIAPFNANQLEAIQALRRALPAQYRLAVKDHPSSSGIQTLDFYRKLARLPDVSLIEGRFDSARVAGQALFSATITGTIAMESALMGVPALMFGDSFFAAMPGVFRCRALADLPRLVPEMAAWREKGGDDDALRGFILGLMRDSVACPRWDCSYGWLDDSVVDAMAELLLRAIQYDRGRRRDV